MKGITNQDGIPGQELMKEDKTHLQKSQKEIMKKDSKEERGVPMMEKLELLHNNMENNILLERGGGL